MYTLYILLFKMENNLRRKCTNSSITLSLVLKCDFLVIWISSVHFLGVKKYSWEESCNVRNVFHKFRLFYGRHNRATEMVIQAVMSQLRTRYSLLDISPPTRMRREKYCCFIGQSQWRSQYVNLIFSKVGLGEFNQQEGFTKGTRSKP